MKKKLLILIMSLIVFLGITTIAINTVGKYPFKNANNERVLVEKGDNFNIVINRLKGKNVIKNYSLLKLYIKINDISPNIKEGEYIVSKDYSLEKFIKDLEKGNSVDNIKITIPEGYTIEDIATLFDKKGFIKREDFLKGCKEYDIPKYIKQEKGQKYVLEGYLFPDTYNFKKNLKAQEIISIMLSRFKQVIKEVGAEEEINKNTINDIVTIASIVEKEIKVDSERKKATSVFYNRLQKNMKLESCATVLYSLGYHKDKLYEKDLKIKSPYNTYIIKKLPPGPICSPGKASLIAALKPDKTDYLYFVSQNDGTHFFTNDYKEFLKVKKRTQGF